jgi:LAS superfamily LD-carboxypeptidase LdcB
VTSPQPGRRLRHASRLRAIVIALVSAMSLATALLAGSLAAPGGTLALGPLPACRYDDILTSPRGYGDWAETLVDTILRVPRSYVPPDLVSVSQAGIGGSGQVRAIAIPDLTAMTAAAKANGTPIAVQSAYRSYTTQIATFQYWVNLSGYKQALLYSARPGHSEHQLGLAIDFKSAAGGPPWSGTDWGTSPAGSWMKAHAWEYGFIQSYPKGKVRKTCYDYESWHFRYVGVSEAAAIHASGLTLREYLWAHYTTAVVPPAPTTRPSTPSVAVSSAVPSATASLVPSDEPSVAVPGEPASPDATAVASDEASASPPPDATPPPTSPVGAAAGIDAVAWIAAAGLLVALVGLAVALALSRRSGGRRGPKGQSGAGLTG